MRCTWYWLLHPEAIPCHTSRSDVKIGFKLLHYLFMNFSESENHFNNENRSRIAKSFADLLCAVNEYEKTHLTSLKSPISINVTKVLDSKTDDSRARSTVLVAVFVRCLRLVSGAGYNLNP